MVSKIRRTKGNSSSQNKTNRKETTDAVRLAMVAKSTSGDSVNAIPREFNKWPSTTGGVINRAKERSKRLRIPLTDIACVQNSPGKRGGKRKFIDAEEEEIVESITQNREKRHRSELEIIKEEGLNYSKSTLQKILYKYYQHHLPRAEKPELTPTLERLRVDLAEEILGTGIETIIWIDQANMRSKYGRLSSWHAPNEYFHQDVIQKTTKQDYQRVEFIRAIKYNEPPGPYRVFFKETLEELKEADALLVKMQEQERPVLVKEFRLIEEAKDVNFTPKLHLFY